jgi:hypothetical protein
MRAIILIRTDHIEQHPQRMQEIATPDPAAVDGHHYTPKEEHEERTWRWRTGAETRAAN